MVSFPPHSAGISFRMHGLIFLVNMTFTILVVSFSLHPVLVLVTGMIGMMGMTIYISFISFYMGMIMNYISMFMNSFSLHPVLVLVTGMIALMGMTIYISFISFYMGMIMNYISMMMMGITMFMNSCVGMSVSCTSIMG